MADISKITTLNGTTYGIKDAKAIHNGTALMTTNPFAGDGHSASALYIPKIDNALYCASKRFNVTVSGEYIAFNGTDSLFNGRYDANNLRIADDKQVTITIDFSDCSGSKMPGYPYGYIYMTFYATNNEPKAISARVYNNYASHTIGWKTITFNKVFGSVYMAEQECYGLQTIEITLTGNGQTSYGYTALSQIDMWLTRPDPNNTPFLFKGGAQTLYYKLTAPEFVGSGASLTNLNANNIASGTVPVARLPVATSSTDGIMTSTEKNKLDGIAKGAEVNVQSNWNETNTSSAAYILNKPTLGSAAEKSVDTSIAAASTSSGLPTSQAVAAFVEGKGYRTDSDLPDVTSSDNGKVLRVVDGEWAVASPVYTIGRERYSFNSIEVSAGAVGSRGKQVSVPYDIDGLPLILGIFISYISDSSACIPVAFATGNTIYLNLYRTSTSAHTVSVDIIVSYLKENWKD